MTEKTGKNYNKYLPIWRKIDRVCDGDEVEQYLIRLNPHDTSEDNKARNDDYRARAVFYGVAGYTLSGLLGLIYSKWPQFTRPDALAYLDKNADGQGRSIFQQAQYVTAEVLRKSRAALYVSFPRTEKPLSLAEMRAGAYVPKIDCITAEQIIYWRVASVGSVAALVEVVIAEIGEDHDGSDIEQRRRLTMQSERLTVEILRKDSHGEWMTIDAWPVRDSTGAQMQYIPFYFVGAQSNSTGIEAPLMRNVSDITLALYRNSADWEDTVFFAGQAQPWMSGITPSHAQGMRENKMYVGSRELLPVPDGGQFGISAAPANLAIRQAMQDKIQMLVGLGARFIVDAGPAKTETQAEGELAATNSIIASVASNVGEAYTAALGACLDFVGVDDDVLFLPNMEFAQKKYTTEDALRMSQMFVQQALPLSSYFYWLKKAEFVRPEMELAEFAAQIGGDGLGLDN
jgi:hypothetical protein